MYVNVGNNPTSDCGGIGNIREQNEVWQHKEHSRKERNVKGNILTVREEANFHP